MGCSEDQRKTCQGWVLETGYVVVGWKSPSVSPSLIDKVGFMTMTHYLSILGIFKNEAHIFVEWIEHYLKEGVDHFFLVDNGSTDDYKERISSYRSRITLYERLERHAQVKIYNEILESIRTSTEWLMPIDLDEFVYSRHGIISEYLATLGPAISQVQVPWRFFASSGLVKQPDLVVPNFLYRWETGNDDTIECKSVVRSSAALSLDIHVHKVRGKTITSDGSEVARPTAVLRVSNDLHMRSNLICNHYVLQSKDWFFGVKAIRGDVGSAKYDLVRNQEYWNERDRNEVLDTELALKRSAAMSAASAQADGAKGELLAASDERPKYWSAADEGEATLAQLALIPEGSRVLEVGTAAGHVTRALKHKGCQVTGIEVDPDLARLAAPACRRVIVGNVEDLDLDAELSEEFDVVLCGDVLEHLRDPGFVLQKLKRRLAPTGHLVVSMPNVAHASVRLNLLAGTFAYVEEGLLDATHLRFFTLASIAELFNRNGFEIRDLYRARSGLFSTEIKLAPAQVNAFAVRQVVQDQEATSYQFVFRAFPSGRSNELADLRDPAFDAARELREFHALCMKRAWEAFHRQAGGRYEARAWAWLALVAQPSPRAALHWMRSFIPAGAKRLG
jgi:2-polyprenyl-3-methyl-5-hydroxy-6-metoxy-1,4-benzoquinol methylase